MKSIMKTVLAAGAVAISMATSAFAQEIIVVAHGQANDPFWSVVKNGVEEAGKDTGVKVEYRAPETFDMVAMSQLIDAAVNQEPAGLIVSIRTLTHLGHRSNVRLRQGFRLFPSIRFRGLQRPWCPVARWTGRI